MSRQRNRGIDESGLETLLDTVCNTLGVVVFICILLVLQINAERPHADELPPTPESESQLAERKQQIEATRERVEQLKAASDQQKRVVARLANPESLRLVSRLKQQVGDQAQRMGQKQKTMSEIAQAQQAANATAQQLADQRSTLEEVKAQVVAAERALKSEIEKRSKTSTFPEGRESQREMIGILLKGGVMYRIHVMQPDRTFNQQEVQRIKEAMGEFIEPIMGSGLRITPQAPNSSEIVQRLRGYVPAKHVLRIFFWADSFAEFQVLRDVLVEQSLHYSPEPVPNKTRIQSGGQSGAIFEQ